MRIEDIIKTKGNVVITVSEDAYLCDAARIMKRHGIGALVVVTDAGELHGVLSEKIAENLVLDDMARWPHELVA